MLKPYEMNDIEETPRNTRTSYGIACCRYDKMNRRWKIMLVKKRYSHCFVAFVFGQYTKKDDKRLRYLFDNMTYQEKIDIISMRFDLLWYKIWLELPNVSSKNIMMFDTSTVNSIINTWRLIYKQKTTNTHIPYNVNTLSKLNFYIKRKSKFESTFACDNGERLRNLMEGTNNIELSWEIPKGRKQHTETKIDCAIREFEEETGFGVGNYTLMFDIDPIKEIFVSMGIQYTHVYYLAFAHKSFDPDKVFHNRQNMSEIDSVKWVDLDELKYLDGDIRLYRTVLKAINTMKSRHVQLIT